jgi:leucyl aminopeptidase
MELRAKIAYDGQEAVVLLTGKKQEALPELPDAVVSELQAFSAGDEKYRCLHLGGRYYFFIGGQASDEELRVSGHKIRADLPNTVESLLIHGGKHSSWMLAEGLVLSGYQFLKYRKDRDKKANRLAVVSFTANIQQEKLDELEVIRKAVYRARDLVNEPVSFLTATELAEQFRQMGEEAGIEVSVLGKGQIEALKMGGLLAVNKGSVQPPSFTIMEYKPKKAVNKRPVVLVGKGVVYDTGGLSLKPTPNSMDLMKSDMGGAACVAGTIYAAALLKLPVHIITLVPATDNRPGGDAYAPGDIVTMFDGTTVEVLNTDAEGRMILADALAYSNKYRPMLVIDAATLTGAAVRAIGTKAAIIMGNAADDMFGKLEAAGNETHERVVRFPFWDEYLEEMRSPIADLKNIGGPYAGMITAGKFLEHFVKSPYIHMDIAGPSFSEKPEDYKGLGGTGYGIRLLTNFLKQLQ